MSSSGVDAIDLAESVGVHLDPWQKLFITDCLGEREDGKWAAREAGLLVARQNGKGEVLMALGLAGLFVLGEELILHSAHEFKTAAEAFLRIKNVIDGSSDLSRLVLSMPTSHGDEGVKLKDGRRLRFVARSKSSGRGFSGDRIILDEAQQLPLRAMRALGPTLRARPNPQIIYTGTVPGPENDAEQWESVRDRGRKGSDPRLLWHEHSPVGSESGLVDPDDRDNWYAGNPAMGFRITEEDMAAEREMFRSDAEGFARELMSVWPDGSSASAINQAIWSVLADPDSEAQGPTVYGVDVDPDSAWGAIGVAGQRADGLDHIDLGPYERGIGWIVDRCAELDAKHGPAVFVVDGRSPAAQLIPAMEQRGLQVVVAGLQDVTKASQQALTAVTEATVRHRGQPELTAAALAARKRAVGDGAFVFSRRGSDGITPFMACVLALWGHNEGKGGGPNLW